MQFPRSPIVFAGVCCALVSSLSRAQPVGPSGVGSVGGVASAPAPAAPVGQVTPGPVAAPIQMVPNQVVAPQGAPPVPPNAMPTPINGPVVQPGTVVTVVTNTGAFVTGTVPAQVTPAQTIDSTTPGTVLFPARPTDAFTAAFPNNAPFPALPTNTVTPTQNTGTLGGGTTGSTTQTFSEVVTGPQTLGTITARDNAQLQGSQLAAETTRVGGFGAAQNNALAAQARLAAQFDNAPSNIGDAAGSNPIFGMPLPGQTPSSQNPANTGPVPGSVVTTAPAQTFVVTTIDPRTVPSTATATGREGQTATSTGGATGFATPPTTSRPVTSNVQAMRAPTRIYTYGPRGGDNVTGQLRVYEQSGQFRFSPRTNVKNATTARTTAQAQAR